MSGTSELTTSIVDMIMFELLNKTVTRTDV